MLHMDLFKKIRQLHRVSWRGQGWISLTPNLHKQCLNLEQSVANLNTSVAGHQERPGSVMEWVQRAHSCSCSSQWLQPRDSMQLVGSVPFPISSHPAASWIRVVAGWKSTFCWYSELCIITAILWLAQC